MTVDVLPKENTQPTPDAESPSLAWDGERFIPGMGNDIELEHHHRYLVAREFAKGKRVLDIACGTGYGSAAMAQTAATVTGVDLSADAVAYAQGRYQISNLRFLEGSAAQIPIPSASIDLVVSFETIEHHDQHQEMMAEIRRVLVPDGLLIISSPDKHEYSDIPHHSNEFHVKELYRDEFVYLIRQHFKNVELYGQRVIQASLLSRLDHEATRFAHFAKAAGSEEVEGEMHPGVLRPLYFIALASDTELPVVDTSVFEIEPEHVHSQLNVRGQEDLAESKLYWGDPDGKFSEDRTLAKMIAPSDSPRVIDFVLPPDALSVGAVRFDPLDRPGRIVIQQITLLNPDNGLEWEWSGAANTIENAQSVTIGADSSTSFLHIYGTTYDPSFELKLPEQLLGRLAAGWTIRFNIVWAGDNPGEAKRNGDVFDVERGFARFLGQFLTHPDSHLERLASTAPSILGTLEKRNEALHYFGTEIASLVTKVSNLHPIAQAFLDRQEELTRRAHYAERDLMDNRALVEKNTEEIAALQRKLASLQEADARKRILEVELAVMRESTSWRITRPLRALRSIFTHTR